MPREWGTASPVTHSRTRHQQERGWTVKSRAAFPALPGLCVTNHQSVVAAWHTPTSGHAHRMDTNLHKSSLPLLHAIPCALFYFILVHLFFLSSPSFFFFFLQMLVLTHRNDVKNPRGGNLQLEFQRLSTWASQDN